MPVKIRSENKSKMLVTAHGFYCLVLDVNHFLKRKSVLQRTHACVCFVHVPLQRVEQVSWRPKKKCFLLSQPKYKSCCGKPVGLQQRRRRGSSDAPQPASVTPEWCVVSIQPCWSHGCLLLRTVRSDSVLNTQHRPGTGSLAHANVACQWNWVGLSGSKDSGPICLPIFSHSMVTVHVTAFLCSTEVSRLDFCFFSWKIEANLPFYMQLTSLGMPFKYIITDGGVPRWNGRHLPGEDSREPSTGAAPQQLNAVHITTNRTHDLNEDIVVEEKLRRHQPAKYTPISQIDWFATFRTFWKRFFRVRSSHLSMILPVTDVFVLSLRFRSTQLPIRILFWSSMLLKTLTWASQFIGFGYV